MKSELEFKSYNTTSNFQLINITKDVSDFIKKNSITKGNIAVTTQHTTTAIIINENEELLLEDIKNHLSELTPMENDYMHDKTELRKNLPEGEKPNAHAHLNALILGASETIPISEGKLVLGPWQSVLLVELDGPRKRNFSFSLIGE